MKDISCVTIIMKLTLNMYLKKSYLKDLLQSICQKGLHHNGDNRL